MTQQQEKHEPPVWVALGILAAVSVFFIVKLAVYNGQIEIIAAALTTADIIGIILGIGGIVIGLIVAYYQNKQSRRMNRIITETHARENTMKTEILERIRFNTNDILTILTMTQRLFDRHVSDPNQHPWQEVTDYLTDPNHRLIERVEELGRGIMADFTIIALLINDRILYRTFWNRCVWLTIFTLRQVVELRDPQDIREREKRCRRVLEIKFKI